VKTQNYVQRYRDIAHVEVLKNNEDIPPSRRRLSIFACSA
jgi:hypothetical protein